ARAKAVLAADIERKPGFQPSLVLAQEAGHAAKVIIVTVAEHEGVERARVDPQEIGVVDQSLGREAEIDENLARLGAAPGFDVHRKAELADQRLAGGLVAADAPAEVLDVDAVRFSA